MADKKISQLTNITGANVNDATDELAIVDASTNTTNAITRAELFKGIDGNVGIGTSSPSSALTVQGTITGSAVTQSSTDTTAGRLLKVGDAGILGNAVGPDIADCNDPVWGSKEKFGTTTLNSPEKGTYNTAGVLESQKWNDNAGFQLARTFFPSATKNNAYFRTFQDGVFGDWQKVYTTGDFELTQSPTDATAGRVPVLRGDGIFGLGGSNMPVISDWTDLTKPSGFYRSISSDIGGPNGSSVFGAGFLLMRFAGVAHCALVVDDGDSVNAGETWTKGNGGTWRKQYDTGNAVGTIAGGALIESGSTANGSYRWTDDGTLECWATVTLTQTNGNRLDFDWSFPVEFDSGESPNIQITINEAASSVTPVFEAVSVKVNPPGANPHVTTKITMRTSGVGFDPADTAVVFVKAIGKKTP